MDSIQWTVSSGPPVINNETPPVGCEFAKQFAIKLAESIRQKSKLTKCFCRFFEHFLLHVYVTSKSSHNQQRLFEKKFRTFEVLDLWKQTAVLFLLEKFFAVISIFWTDQSKALSKSKAYTFVRKERSAS